MSASPEVYTQSVGVPRWLFHSGLAELLGGPQWWVFLALVATESRLIRLRNSWAPEAYCDWFRLRVRQELVPTTGLCDRSVSRALKELQERAFIRCEIGAGRRPTRVRFEERMIDRLCWHILPALPAYLGGIRDRSPLPERLYIWNSPHSDGFGGYWPREKLELMITHRRSRDRDIQRALRLSKALTGWGGEVKALAAQTKATMVKERRMEPTDEELHAIGLAQVWAEAWREMRPGWALPRKA